MRQILNFLQRKRSSDKESPTAPSNLIFDNITTESIELSWSPSIDNRIVVNYGIYNADTETLITYTNSTDIEYNLTGLNPNSIYYIFIKAIDSSGNESDNSNVIEFKTLLGDIEYPIIIPSSETIGGEAINLFDDNFNTKWYTNAVNPEVTIQYETGQTFNNYYMVSAEGLPSRDPSAWVILGSNNGLDWTTLDTQTSQSFSGRQVAKFYSFANSTSYIYYKLDVTASAGAMSSFQLADWTLGSGVVDVIAPTIPSSFNATNVTNTTIDLTWGASTDAGGMSGYRIYNSGVLIASTGNITSYTLSGLTEGVGYNLTIRGLDIAGNESGDSNSQSFTTTEDSSYTLTEDKRVSIGVYDINDNLLRTLVTNEAKTAGTHTLPSWDGFNDDGADVTAQGDHYLIVANAIEAEWEGIIGSTSADLVGTNKWKAQNFPKETLIIGNEMFFGWGSNERSASVQKMDLDDPQRRIALMPEGRIYPGFNHIAYDGTRLYMAGKSHWDVNGQSRSYLCSSTIANLGNYNNWHTFSSGTTVNIYSSTYKITDYVEDLVNQPVITGLCVQTGNDNIFVFREVTNSIHVLHKNTGALRQDITTYDNPKLGKIDANGYLWFIHGDGSETLEKFTINNSTGEITTTGVTLTGLTNVEAFTITPDGTTLVIGDSGTYDIITAYNSTTLSVMWTLGREESYSEDATIYNDKFLFRNHGEFNNKAPRYSSISFESDGSFWVVDEGNERFLHFDSSRNYIEQVIWKSNFYTVNLDHADPTRLFAGFMEYEIDYSKPIVAGNANNSWKQVRNWGRNTYLSTLGIQIDNFQPITGIETFSNGKTYGLVAGNNKTKDLVEFVEGDVLRATGVKIPYGSRPTVYRKGGKLVTYDAATTAAYDEYTITGFDESNNPILSSKNTWMSINSSTTGFYQQPTYTSVPFRTESDLLILLDPRKGDGGYYHLAGYKQGQSTPVFRTTKSVVYANNAPYPLGTNTFDARTNVINAASRVESMDDWFIWGYYGEGWRQTQTNYWHMLTEEGLFLYDFGTDGKNVPSESYSRAGMAGNAFGFQLVKVGEQVYLYHNDESFHGGIHRWKINNLGSVQKFEIPL